MAFLALTMVACISASDNNGNGGDGNGGGNGNGNGNGDDGGNGDGNGNGGGDIGKAHPRFPNHALAWQDEFNGTAIDTSVWRYDTSTAGNGAGWGNNELQWYTDSANNAHVADGILTIEARHEQQGNKAYTSARLHTHGGRAFRYGVIEARIRMPAGSNGRPDGGIFPALWMLGDNFNGWGHSSYGGDTPWPRSGEIDIMEVLPSVGGFNKVYGSAHWHEPDRPKCKYNSYLDQHCSGPKQHDISSTTLYDQYHIYSMMWNPDTITWYFDYQQYATLDIRDAQFDEFRKEFFILLNLAIGGLGNEPTPANYPQQMLVDWIHHYCPTDSNGACTSL